MDCVCSRTDDTCLYLIARPADLTMGGTHAAMTGVYFSLRLQRFYSSNESQPLGPTFSLATTEGGKCFSGHGSTHRKSHLHLPSRSVRKNPVPRIPKRALYAPIFSCLALTGSTLRQEVHLFDPDTATSFHIFHAHSTEKTLRSHHATNRGALLT